METTITTTPFDVSTSSTPTTRTTSMRTTTTTTSTLETSTIESVENVVVSSYDQTLPREKSHIIIMTTVIPIVWIAFIIALVWVKRRTGVLSGIFDPFTDSSNKGESSSSYELSTVSEA